jgi:hypothetical protein
MHDSQPSTDRGTLPVAVGDDAALLALLDAPISAATPERHQLAHDLVSRK